MAGFPPTARAAAVAFIVFCTVFLVAPSAARAVGGEGESWPSFNESDACGSPWMRGPNVERSGWLSASTVLRGPHADYFGRTVDQVWDSLDWWDVPMSDGESLRLHERLAPALGLVEQNLAAASASGNSYLIKKRYTFGYAARTVGGSYRVSQHTLGNAIDINSTTNPYRTSSLRTDMPSWFVDAWSDAGFCWGGKWVSVKDPMHYNWRGPLFTPGMTELPASYPVSTAAEGFTRTMHTDSVPGTMDSTRFRLLMDADNDGAIDVVNVTERDATLVIDVVGARKGFLACSVARYPTGTDAPGGTVINGDWDRDGAQDLWVIDDEGGDLRITAFLRFGDFTETDEVTLAIGGGDQYLSADHDVDGWGDLYVFTHTGSAWSVTVLSGADRFTTTLATAAIAGPSSMQFTALDRDLDHVPDLFGVDATGSVIAFGDTSFASTEAIAGVSGSFDDIAGTDLDGDGRHDLALLDEGSLRVLAGNSRLGGVRVTSWFEWPTYDCSGNGLAYPYEGTFRDDDQSVHRFDIEEIALTSITRGCNPPLNDEFCPDRTINRGELAAFLRRALSLPAGSGSPFSDIEGHLFEGDVEALAAAGITVACDAAGTRFCPDTDVSRDVMAEFLVQAFGFAASDADAFVDDDDSAFESSIDAIAAIGVTKGCNPPDNDRFCPDRTLTREEMASFMVRALDLRALDETGS